MHINEVQYLIYSPKIHRQLLSSTQNYFLYNMVISQNLFCRHKITLILFIPEKNKRNA